MGIFSKDSIKIKDKICTAKFERYGALDYDRTTSLFKGKSAGCDSVHIEIGDDVTDGYVYMPPSINVVDYTVSPSNRFFKSVDGNLYSKDGKQLIKYATGKTQTRFVIPEGVTELPLCAFWGADKLKSIVLPSTMKRLGAQAFSSCTSLKEMIIPDGVTVISNAFLNCKSIERIVIPKTVEIIETTDKQNFEIDAFAGCERLKSIEVSEENNNYKSIDGNLYSKNGRTLIKYAVGKSQPSFTVPNGVKTIAYCAFKNCNSLEELDMPDSVETVSVLAFFKCINLKKVTLSRDLEKIEGSAFKDCRMLREIIIPQSVKEIERSAFENCPSLTIKCIANNKPQGWADTWTNAPGAVVWGYKASGRKMTNDEE